MQTYKEFLNKEKLTKTKLKTKSKKIISSIVNYYSSNQGLKFGDIHDESKYIKDGASFVSYLGTIKEGAPFISIESTLENITVSLGFYKSNETGNSLVFDSVIPDDHIISKCKVKLDNGLREKLFSRKK